MCQLKKQLAEPKDFTSSFQSLSDLACIRCTVEHVTANVSSEQGYQVLCHCVYHMALIMNFEALK
jgi:hypothetical protein